MKRNKRTKHGLKGLMAAISVRGLTALDARSAGVRALMQWRSELERDLGGAETLSAQELTLVELCCRTRLLLDHVDSWLLCQPSLINRRRKALLPIIHQRQQLADALARHLTTLGLKRREKEVTLQDYLASDEYAAKQAAAQPVSPHDDAEAIPSQPVEAERK